MWAVVSNLIQGWQLQSNTACSGVCRWTAGRRCCKRLAHIGGSFSLQVHA